MLQQRWYHRLSILLLLFVLALVPAQANQPVPIGPGATLLTLYQPEGPWAIHLVTAELTNVNLKAESLLGGGMLVGRQGVSGMLAGSAYDWHKPIVGINGDYFANTGKNHTTIPLGFHLQNGELITLPDGFRSAFYLTTEGKAGIERFQASAWISGPNDLLYPISVMNRAPNTAEVALFTPTFGLASRAESTSTQITLADISGKIVPNGQVTAKVTYVGVGDQCSIPPNGAVLAANGVAAWALKDLKVDDEVTLRVGIKPDVGELKQVIGGGPRLVRDSTVSVEYQLERFDSSFASRRHPRTGVGVKGSEVMLVTVDGRQPGYSEGMSLPEFAQLFAQLGCTDAINLDGGGSTTMVVRGKVVNAPSDGGERKVANALALFSLAPPLLPGAPPRPAKYLTIEPQEANLLTGETVKLNVTALDEYAEPTPVQMDRIQWLISNGFGAVASDGTFIAGNVAAPTAGTVTAKLDGISIATAVSVSPLPSRLSLSPAHVALAPGGKQQFTVRAYDANGQLLQITPDRLIWSCTPETEQVSNRGLFRAPNESGSYTVSAAIGSVSTSVNVLVGEVSQVVQDFEKETSVTFFTSPPGLPGSATIAEDPLLKGNSCLKLSYDFTTTTESRAAHAVLALPLPETPAIAMRVLGDGGGTWLRAKLRDSANNIFLLDLAQHLSWSQEWKEVTGWLPLEAVPPVTLESIYVSEFHADQQPKGDIYLDDISVTARIGGQETTGNGE